MMDFCEVTLRGNERRLTGKYRNESYEAFFARLRLGRSKPASICARKR